MNVLMVGDVVGSPGRRLLARVATEWKQRGQADVVVANGENAAGGRGITGQVADELFAGGVDVVTLGDHTWNQKEVVGAMERETRLVRPANFPPGCPGRGWTTVQTRLGAVTVVNLIGRVFMAPQDCPFRAVDAVLREHGGRARVILVDLHAEATSEKVVMGRYLDGRVSAVAGTHTHVQTSDETILPGGSAYITDLGMTGARDSALGRDLKSVTAHFLTGMPTVFKVAEQDVAIEGVLIDVDETTGRSRSIRRVRERA